MAEEILVIPPIRQSLEDAQSAKNNEIDQPLTEKSWYLFWQRGADQINLNTDKLGKMITYGTHAGRPSAGTMPNSALYMEGDRGGAIYQNINGAWKYRAGTMFGTLSPDQRPTDLGVNDAGFQFRSVDSDPLLTAREFLWSQSAWIEITPVLYGAHAARPVSAAAPARCLYVETDRGNVLYQNQNGVWHYLAGTMFGTLSPDQRPTDLGVNDVGFNFRTSVPPAREFIWSQSAWIETTSAQTPWLSNIDGGGYSLSNVSTVTAGSYLVAGLQVVGARLAAVAAPSIFTITMTRTPGNTYTSNEKDMLSDLAAAVNWLNTDVTNLQTAVNDIRSRLGTHGLTG